MQKGEVKSLMFGLLSLSKEMLKNSGNHILHLSFVSKEGQDLCDMFYDRHWEVSSFL